MIVLRLVTEVALIDRAADSGSSPRPALEAGVSASCRAIRRQSAVHVGGVRCRTHHCTDTVYTLHHPEGVSLHPSTRARDFRELVSTPHAGTQAEADALQAIDRLRHEEVNPPTLKQRRRRARAHWRDRDNALGG